MQILLVEDDEPVAAFVQKGLEAENYSVEVVDDGATAKDVIEQNGFDLVVLDLGLPGMDGLEVLKHIRRTKPSLPILILTGRATVEERVRGLSLGADDYMVKPFSFRELVARVRALLRRQMYMPAVTLRVGDLEMDRVARVAVRNGQRLDLTTREFALLEYLMRNSERTVSRDMIIEHVWNFSGETHTNVVDVFINYLRKKVDGLSDSKLIHTVRGVGYQLSLLPPF